MSDLAPLFDIGAARTTVTRSLDPQSAKWIDVREADWVDEAGKPHLWEYVTRKTKSPNTCHAVYIIALVVLPDGTVAVPIVMQYRPPVNALVVEFPAGLVEPGENEVECALRELYEETGFGRKGAVEIVSVSKPLCTDAGVCATSIRRVEIVIKIDQEDDMPQVDRFSQNGVEEHIVSGLVSLSSFADMIQDLAEKPRYLIASSVQTYADGLRHFATTTEL